MKKETNNINVNKQLIDKLFINQYGEEYTKIIDEDSIDKCDMLNFLMHKEEMKQCRHVFVPNGFNFGNTEFISFLCIKCGLNNKYPNMFSSDALIKKDEEKLEIFELTKENSIVLDCFDNPEQLRILYIQTKKILPGLSDEEFIDYINYTFSHYQLNDVKKKAKKK